ncbi:DUF456 domain-containing protein [Aestuariimicrobium soli]|uniref:DUF456 domain-containing protein n=1 Tax=Aestuariimicrobium soli TaxID=2035834 RepID=UPI003EB88EBE
MPAELAALAAALLCLVGIAGIVSQVLPGSVFVGAGLLVWAVFGNAPWPWAWFAGGLVLVVIGAIASTVLTGGELKKRGIPNWTILVALLVGVVAGFYVPVVGMLVGFVLTLLVCEWIRVKEFRLAVRTSAATVRAVGVGMLVELACALLACNLLGVSMLVGFLA